MEIIKFIQSFSTPLLDGLFQLITMLGEAPFFLLSLAVFLWCVDQEFGYKLGLAILTSSVLNAGIKEVFQVPRPIGLPGIRSLRLETAGGYSFPSGHTQSATVFWVSVMLKSGKKWVWVLGSVLILSVAVSRLYLGVHFPVDVIGGVGIGAVWVLISNGLFDYTLCTGKKEAFLLIFIPMYLGLYFVADVFYYKITGAATGLILGYLIERRYIQYQVQAGFGRQVCKIVLGLAGLVLVTILLKQALPETAFCDLLRYFLMGFWMTVLAPLLFKILFKSEKA
ncbi:MAG TPA: phosphatase PAP2 family protein [Firmicutes bacterium]|nr:phosphatase PAP2 family protein [Bacillota bacterium]